MTDVREKAKRSWDNWTEEDAQQELAPWPGDSRGVFLVAVDPSSTASGVAVFNPSGQLVDAKTVRLEGGGVHERSHRMARHLANHVSRFGSQRVRYDVVIEWPRVYPRRTEEDPNDLFHVAAVGSMFVALVDSSALRVRWPAPSDWKAGRPKRAVMNHVLGHEIKGRYFPGRLTDDEKKVIQNIKDHNCIEAIGIGLWALGRFG